MSAAAVNPTVEDLTILVARNCRARHHFDTRNLVLNHPPQFTSKNKQIVYNESCPYAEESHTGKLRYAQYTQFQLPKSFNPQAGGTEITGVDGVFQYSPPEDPIGSVEWHVNFADAYLFGYWKGSLFAQDESQTLEHPSLCSLQSMLNNGAPFLSCTREADGKPTPVLIRGVERKSYIQTDANPDADRPYGLYGNRFAYASPESVKRALILLPNPRQGRDGKPYFSNILAMEAPHSGHGEYDISSLMHVLEIAFTAFLAARCESFVELGRIEDKPTKLDGWQEKDELPVAVGEVPKEAGEVVAEVAGKLPSTIIHTGNWGCGAYGGNLTVMYLMQMAAAELAGIDKIVFHFVNEKQVFSQAHKLYEDLRVEGGPEMTVHQFCEKVGKKRFKWGYSDGN
ncbi:hypothetical protein BC936DRAFT_138375 [Jimgerdemannia flammicorona]|uniref:PARG catalytic Macro domain-containing protein n=1 Tax=Jimgerdemannia flammicorona TaxID=994334 RepID=A0A433CK67_9FUNG|nr:hypothetical protein BC936DRAFT_138375 [Jimgerdemannia flammicorona]